MMKENKNKAFDITITIISIILVAGLGTLFVNLGNEWFDSLTKASEWIPNFFIPVFWTVIYVAFAVVLIIWQRKNRLNKNIFILLVINGALNVLWCLVFFTFNQLFLGNIVIIFNFFFAIRLVVEINKDNKIFGWILSIYPFWLAIATTLNLAVWILN